MNLDLYGRVSLTRKGSRLCKAILAIGQLLIWTCLLATRTIPDDSLDLARPRVAINITVGGPTSSPSKVVIPTPRHLLLLVQLTCIQVFEKIAFLALIIAYIESVASHIILLLLSVEVVYHGQGIVIRTLCHGHRVCRLLLYSVTKTVLVLAWLLGRRVSHRRLDAIWVRFHNFLSRARLPRHCLTAASATTTTRVIVIGLLVVLCTISRGSHPILLDTATERVSGVVKIVGCEGKSVQICSLVLGSDIWISSSWVPWICLLLWLLLIFQISFHELSYGRLVASRVILVLVSGAGIAMANAYHRGWLGLRVALTHPFTILNITIALEAHLL